MSGKPAAISVPKSPTVSTNSKTPVGGIIMVETEIYTMLLRCLQGKLQVTAGLTVSGNDTAAITVKDSFLACQTIVASLKYTAPAIPLSDIITVTVRDASNSSSTASIPVTVKRPAGNLVQASSSIRGVGHAAVAAIAEHKAPKLVSSTANSLTARWS